MRATVIVASGALAALLWAIPAASPAAAQAQKSVEVAVDSPRRLLDALYKLEKRLGWVLTYEDPEWTFAGDLQDRSVLLGQPYDATRPDPVPKGGPFKFSFPVTARLTTAEGRAELVQALLHDYHLLPDHHGEFTMIQTADAIHVVPAQAKNAQGQLETRTSLLDTPIQLAAGTRSAMAVTQEVINAVASATGKKVGVFLVPTNLFFQTKVTVDERATDNTARAALIHILKATGRPLSWSLAYLPGAHQGYALSVHAVGAGAQ